MQSLSVHFSVFVAPYTNFEKAADYSTSPSGSSSAGSSVGPFVGYYTGYSASYSDE